MPLEAGTRPLSHYGSAPHPDILSAAAEIAVHKYLANHAPWHLPINSLASFHLLPVPIHPHLSSRPRIFEHPFLDARTHSIDLNLSPSIPRTHQHGVGSTPTPKPSPLHDARRLRSQGHPSPHNPNRRKARSSRSLPRSLRNQRGLEGLPAEDPSSQQT